MIVSMVENVEKGKYSSKRKIMYILVCIYGWIYEGLLYLEYLDVCIWENLDNIVQYCIMNISVGCLMN